jgi:hypothetical protein
MIKPSKECDFCIKQRDHGGECNGRYKNTPCLYFEHDIRGERLRDEAILQVHFGENLPNCFDTITVIIQGIEKDIEIYRIDKIEWDRSGRNSGLIGVLLHISYGYWSDQNGIIPVKPDLRLIVNKPSRKDGNDFIERGEGLDS